MKALVYTGTMQSEIRDEPAPIPSEGQAHVNITHCGICGSDMHAWHGHDERRIPPLILGHEAVGIASNGKYKGKRVAINPLHTCGTCRHCMAGDDHICPERQLMSMQLPGAYAEETVASEKNLYPIDDTLSFEDAALAEPLAVCIHAIEVARKTLRRPISESRIAVLGGGAIGVLTAIVLVDQGCKDLWIAEPNEKRRAVLEKACKVKAYDPFSDGPPAGTVDAVIDAVGMGATRKASTELVIAGGTIVHIGLQDNNEGLDTRRITLQEVHFSGTYCYSRYDFAAALNLLTRGLVQNRDWIEVRPLDEGAQSFMDIHEGNAPPKIILSMK